MNKTRQIQNKQHSRTHTSSETTTTNKKKTNTNTKQITSIHPIHTFFLPLAGARFPLVAAVGVRLGLAGDSDLIST
jgi:hypothetical protein